MRCVSVSLPDTGRERFVVSVAHTEEEGGGQERVREHPALPPAPVLGVGGVVVAELGLAGGWRGRDTAAHWDELHQEAP